MGHNSPQGALRVCSVVLSRSSYSWVIPVLNHKVLDGTVLTAVHLDTCQGLRSTPVRQYSLRIYGIGPSCFFTMYAGIRPLYISIWYNSSLDDASMILHLISVFIEILHF